MEQPDKFAKKEQVTSLKNCVTNTLSSYMRKRRRNKIGAIIVHSVTIGFSSVTTILLGWGLAQPDNRGMGIGLKNAALCFSALATAAGSLEAVFDFRALWVGYNVAISKLKVVLARLNYLEAAGEESVSREQLEDLYSRYDSVCAAMEKDYKDIRTSDDE